MNHSTNHSQSRVLQNHRFSSTLAPSYHALTYSSTGSPSSVINFEESLPAPLPPTKHHASRGTLKSFIKSQYEAGNTGDYSWSVLNKYAETNEMVWSSGLAFDDSEIEVQPLASAVNTADLNTISGTYPIKPSFMSDSNHSYSIPGSEFVGLITSSNSSNSDLQPGSLVLPRTVGLGSWSSHLPPLPAYHFIPVSSITTSPNPSILTLLGMQINPSSAYLMLRNYVPLSPSSTIILTAGKSGVSTAAAVIAKRLYGASVISVIRRKSLSDTEWSTFTESYKSTYNVDMVLSEESVTKTPPKKLIDKVQSLTGEVPLILDCVGGKIGSLLNLTLSRNGCHVTYGGLSREPLKLRAGGSIFSNTSHHGFWLTRWTNYEEWGRWWSSTNPGELLVKKMDERVEMLRDIYRLVEEEESLVLPETKLYHLSDYETAFGMVGKGYKVAFDCRLDDDDNEEEEGKEEEENEGKKE
ncbi:hypothetical protein TrVE_jg13891 [Triparma verrucosa]|uniref:Uncharacterized protein n=1 Tax=Triparma verrucosa TaxID=1606542 RepID=A0A9W7EX02_9STRA|nr:hypothetical protein TrVE_jg13891 [Triparma verrucosa]